MLTFLDQACQSNAILASKRLGRLTFQRRVPRHSDPSRLHHPRDKICHSDGRESKCKERLDHCRMPSGFRYLVRVSMFYYTICRQF